MAKKPKNWDALSPVEQEAWRVKKQESDRKWREANTEKAREKSRKWRNANLEKCRERELKYREANPEKRRKANREWREANRDELRERCRKSYCKSRQQSAADQFFILAGAAEQLTKLKPKQ